MLINVNYTIYYQNSSIEDQKLNWRIVKVSPLNHLNTLKEKREPATTALGGGYRWWWAATWGGRWTMVERDEPLFCPNFSP